MNLISNLIGIAYANVGGADAPQEVVRTISISPKVITISICVIVGAFLGGIIIGRLSARRK